MTTISARPPKAGEAAPDFNLYSTAGSQVMLSSFRGMKFVLLAFFPAAFTRVCTAELCGLSEDFDVFGHENVEVFPISVDAIPSLREFRTKYDMKGQLLSDFRREASKAYGVLREDTFASERAYFLIDPEGIVRWSHVEEHPGMKRDNAEIHEIIKAAMS